MQDPTNGVPPQLLPHVHLISANKYPPYHQFNLDQAYQALFEAPKIVKQIAPMQWQYLAGPQDGTIFLTWIGGRMQNSFASDGYVWADQEQRYTQDFGGYTLEVAVHQSGYRPGIDQVSCHARRRYRFVSKNPAVTALPPDPSLWVVHYSQAEPQSCIPVSQVMVTPQVRAQLNERQWIEQQGRLEQQAFMLHDRDKWPHLNMPGRGGLPGPMYNPGLHSQSPMAHMGNPRFSGQFYQQQAAQQAAVGPSPAKRARQHPPAQMPASAAALMATDTSIEDEENVLYGDILDHLTQRDISLTRYMQHHEWMEEVFSSPYATGKIIPADLGFGLMGELAGLTDGLLDVPQGDQDKALTKNSAETTYKKVTPEQLEEFEKRVKAHMDKGQAELERMKEEHAKKMEGLKKGKTLLQAEKRLRNAVWDPTDIDNEVWRLDRAAMTNGDASTARPKESADDIVKEVETALGGKIQPQKEANLVERGGLKDKVHVPAPPPPPANGNAANGSNGDSEMEGVFDQSMEASQPDFGQQNTTEPAQQAAQVTQTASEQVPQPSAQQAQPQQPMPDQSSSSQQANPTPQPDAEMGNGEAMMDDSLMDDLNMDMDVDTSTLNFDAVDPSPKPVDTSAASNNWGGQESQQPQASAPQPPQQPPQQQQEQQQQQPNEPAATDASVPTTQTNEQSVSGGDQATPDMFASAAGDNGGFGDFDTGDGLIDFDGGEGDIGFDMDNSAFGDAFHGTEAHGDEAGEGA